jgi:pimeloyl-[acyl-carrier protein] methyl ester esterase
VAEACQATCLHVRERGEGTDAVLVHGWGFQGSVWEEIARALSAELRVWSIDLPGFGRSRMLGGPYTLEALGHALAAAAPSRAIWIGWSLGALLCLSLAIRYPERVSRLALVAGTPRFVLDEDWRHALDPKVLVEFRRDLAQDQRRTLQRFAALQVGTGTRGRAALRRLRELLLRPPAPDSRALQGGLELLLRTDLRYGLGAICCPCLLLMGEEDRLVPVRSADQTASMLVDARVQVVRGAGHAPFVSHPQECEEVLRLFSTEIRPERL